MRSNPLALSLNENPFPPLPAVRSALIESIDAANRYPGVPAGAVALPDRRARRGARRAGGDRASARPA